MKAFLGYLIGMFLLMVLSIPIALYNLIDFLFRKKVEIKTYCSKQEMVCRTSEDWKQEVKDLMAMELERTRKK